MKINDSNHPKDRSSHGSCSVEKGVLKKISQISQENTCVGVCF